MATSHTSCDENIITNYNPTSQFAYVKKLCDAITIHNRTHFFAAKTHGGEHHENKSTSKDLIWIGTSASASQCHSLTNKFWLLYCVAGRHVPQNILWLRTNFAHSPVMLKSFGRCYTFRLANLLRSSVVSAWVYAKAYITLCFIRIQLCWLIV